jgi:hypothetical protein
VPPGREEEMRNVGDYHLTTTKERVADKLPRTDGDISLSRHTYTSGVKVGMWGVGD